MYNSSYGKEGNFIPKGLIGVQSNYSAKPEGYLRGALRTWDCRGGTGVVANSKFMAPTSDRVYNLSPIDGMLLGEPEGTVVHVCLGGPPDWMVTRASVGNSTAYGGKFNMVPDDLDSYCDFVDKLTRKIVSYGAIPIFDTWNEINGAGFYNEASYNPLGPYVRAVAATIRNIIPNATIAIPNTNTSAVLIDTILNVSDGAGGKIADHCNAVSMHTYHDRRTVAEVAFHMNRELDRFTARVPSGWKTMMTESGMSISNPRQSMLHTTRLAVCAAKGIEYMAYTSDSPSWGMTEQTKTWWNILAEVLMDSTLISCDLQHGVALRVETDKGVVHITADQITRTA